MVLTLLSHISEGGMVHRTFTLLQVAPPYQNAVEQDHMPLLALESADVVNLD